MTADDRQQLASLQTLVQNEFKHIADRLDSHSRDLKTMSDTMHSVETKLDTHIAIEEASVPVRTENKRSIVSVVIAVVTIIGSAISGWIAGGHH